MLRPARFVGTVDGSNQLWVADIPYIATGFVYLAAILDAWSRRVVVGYSTRPIKLRSRS